MSGDAGGGIAVGAVALAAAPVVISTVAAIGVIYGVARITGFLGKRAIDYAVERKREKELFVNNCSSQLNDLFADLRGVVGAQNDLHVNYIKKLSKEFEELQSDLETIKSTSVDTSAIDRQVAAAHSTMNKKLAEDSRNARNEIMRQGTVGITRCISTIDASLREQEELIKWIDASETDKAMQRTATMSMIRDAKASLKVLENMAKNTLDSAFKTNTESLKNTLSTAESFFEQKMYQSAFSNAKKVIRQSAILASEQVQKELESDMLITEAIAKAESILGNMEGQRYIEFENQTRADKKLTKADLNHFSQTKYKGMMNTLKEQIEYLGSEEAHALPPYEVEKILKKLENEIEPEARHIIETSKSIMQGYYERLHALEVIADHMSQQDYKMDWAVPVGGDPSQKLVVNFKRKRTGNSVSITLDNDASAGDIANMAMEVLMFYDSGREVTEFEKRELRKSLTDALHKAGFVGELGCMGQVNKPSSKPEMNNKDSVKNLTPQTLV